MSWGFFFQPLFKRCAQPLVPEECDGYLCEGDCSWQSESRSRHCLDRRFADQIKLEVRTSLTHPWTQAATVKTAHLPQPQRGGKQDTLWYDDSEKNKTDTFSTAVFYFGLIQTHNCVHYHVSMLRECKKIAVKSREIFPLQFLVFGRNNNFYKIWNSVPNKDSINIFPIIILL